jgi:L-alanine-DL-glutamate epimerase-like enolase superfamily enzyme
VAVGTLDMAVWDAVAKIAGKPLFRLLAEKKDRDANPRVFVFGRGTKGEFRCRKPALLHHAALATFSGPACSMARI